VSGEPGSVLEQVMAAAAGAWHDRAYDRGDNSLLSGPRPSAAVTAVASSSSDEGDALDFRPPNSGSASKLFSLFGNAFIIDSINVLTLDFCELVQVVGDFIRIACSRSISRSVRVIV